MRIGVDLDDTLSIMKKDFDISICNYATSIGKNPNYQKLQQMHKDPNAKHIYSTCCDLTKKEIHQFFCDFHENTSLNVPARENCANVLNKLKAEGDEIYIITAREKEVYPNVENITRLWLKKHNIPYDKLITSATEKGFIAIKEKIDVLIDDCLANCQDVENLGIPSIKFCDYEIENSTNDWLKIYDMISNMKKEKQEKQT